MAYNDLLSRTDASPLIPEEVSQSILQGVEAQSAALSLFTNVRMSSKTQRMPVLSALPVAYFVNGDTGLKQTTKIAWANKYLNAEPMAVIVPVPEEVLDDADYDIWGTVQPLVESAIARALDAAVFFGTNKPASWPTDIVAGSVAAGNTELRDAAAAAGGVAADFNGLLAAVEEDGYDISDVIAKTGLRRFIRGAVDTTGQPLVNVQDGRLFGTTPLQYMMPGVWPSGGAAGTNPEAIAGDFSQGILGVRQDIEWKLLDQAVLTDAANAILLNLAQQDAVAMRVTARFAFQIANPINFDNTNDTTRYPFSVMRV
jgi:HK97 family phage major capsid protein